MKLANINTVGGIIKFLYLPPKEKELVIWIIFRIVLIKLKVKFVPLRKYYHDYFTVSNPEYMQPNLPDIGIIYKIIKYLPVDFSCLEEAMIVKTYMNRLRIEMFIRLGVRTDNDLEAHAWFLPENSHGYKKIN